MRLGKIQAALIQWITDVGGYTYIGSGTQGHLRYGLGGRTLEEVERSLKALVKRGLIVEQKPGFYSLPGWVRPEDEK